METEAVKLGSGGAVAIPEKFRQALGVEAGDEVIIALKDGELRVYTRAHAIKRAQEMVRRLNPEGRCCPKSSSRNGGRRPLPSRQSWPPERPERQTLNDPGLRLIGAHGVSER